MHLLEHNYMYESYVPGHQNIGLTRLGFWMSTNIGEEIVISLWKECIDIPERFNRYAIENAPSPVVLAVTNVKVTHVAGKDIHYQHICDGLHVLQTLGIRFKLVATIADHTDSMNVILSDNAAQKLLGARSDELITEDNPNHQKTMPLLSEKSKSLPIRMTVRMTKTSTRNNIRFMITDVEDNVVQQPPALTTPPTYILLPSDPTD
ncbi:unnamed protein product [Lactuca virosa]|uniref:Uncharacterized protein n=1 Tax=Lactuca virosa TaxID=75947 RepID=A0AAU9NV28_9ASTR|nr:unnamed protein product [Lactuca virosa]